MTKLRTYSELSQLKTFDERYEYLRLEGAVGQTTFGFDRYINQKFYQSREWKDARRFVISRDNGCDLGIQDHPINGGLLIHHINPMNPEDIVHGEQWILDPEYLITTRQDTHNAIHYSDRSLLPRTVIARSPGDTRLW